MYHQRRPRQDDRREDPRVSMALFLNQYVRDQPHRALAVNLSPTGLFVQKLAHPVIGHARTVGLEFELPGTNEIIWARAESRFDAIADDFHVTGLRFSAMAVKHERLIRDFVREKDWLLERMWLRLRCRSLKKN
jgi:c-di-GMP-binding flagellar brake protein YcgR